MPLRPGLHTGTAISTIRYLSLSRPINHKVKLPLNNGTGLPGPPSFRVIVSCFTRATAGVSYERPLLCTLQQVAVSLLAPA